MKYSWNAHLFHIVNSSAWPLLTGNSSFLFVTGIAFFFHGLPNSGVGLLFGFICLLFCVISWFTDIIDEATFKGHHTLVVRNGLKLGFMLFLVSEFMLFFGFFWAYFHVTMGPSMEVNFDVIPEAINAIEWWGIPIINTSLLVFSGFFVTSVHRAIAKGIFRKSIDFLIIAISLGLVFVILQVKENCTADFNLTDGVYSCSFFMLTGLHGCHVIVGVILLVVSFIRLLFRHFLTNHYGGLVYAIWYWHFVDIVWLVLFIVLYIRNFF